VNKENLIKKIYDDIENFKPQITSYEAGEVFWIGDGIVKATGLSDVMSFEVVRFQSGSLGIALNLEEDSVGIVLLGESGSVSEGDEVVKTGRVLEVPVSNELLGRVIDPLGNPIDGKGGIKAESRYEVEKIAPGVIERKSVSESLQTGIKAIDAMIPIGRGQRELIIGDRQTGKTAIALDAVVNQKNKGVVCVYVAIGQKESKSARIFSELEERGAIKQMIFLQAGASDPASMLFLAPFAGAAIAEFFMDQGKDVLIIYDDLSKHAAAYREISLLLRRPPGREAYPGDVFYLHSRLLERACRRDEEYGGGSITALPIIETQAGDVSAYIPTNVISITDGQIYLETDLFHQGIRPALNVGLSVSRVGSAAQVPAMKKVSGKLRLELAQFRELQSFAQFSSDLDTETKKQIERGKRVVEVLKQDEFKPLQMEKQIAILYAVTNGFLDNIPLEKVKDFEESLFDNIDSHGKKYLESIRKDWDLTKQVENELKKILEKVSGVLINADSGN